MKNNKFVLNSDFKPCGDQPQAIDTLVNGILANDKYQTLLGVTGSGKTFTMANIINEVQKPTLILAHNKTLAAQLYGEFKEYFPNNCVEYFVSYFDYYQPEAYIASTDTYIEKDSSLNDEIDQLRHSATASLFERRDVIIIASISCIYGLGDPKDYEKLTVSIRVGMKKDRDVIIRKLIDIQYTRNEYDFKRGTFRVRGDVLEIIPASYSNMGYRIEFFGDEIERITQIDTLTGEIIGTRNHLAIFPASHFATSSDKIKNAIKFIEVELKEQLEYFKKLGKHLEYERLEQRTKYDLEMMKNVGFCSGIENYSRHINNRKKGTPPKVLLDYFPDDYLMFIDESHVTVPQSGGMYKGDKSRKNSLVEFGFRLPSAYDHRPLNFDEFEERQNQVVYVSATPSTYEIEKSSRIVEQIIRPTGLIDPNIEIRPIEGQVDDLIGEIRNVVKNNNRVLVTTLTKKMAENLTDYMDGLNIKVKYLHSDIETMERTRILKELRLGEFDVLIGINLLREGLDLPEVELVAILDADREGFLRSARSLIQTVGRAARNIDGRVIMYANNITKSMKLAISETDRRREIQSEYNEKYNITPKSIIKAIRDTLETVKKDKSDTNQRLDIDNIDEYISTLQNQMKQAAKILNFEKAAMFRDELKKLKEIKNDIR